MTKKTLILFDKDTPPEDALRAIREAHQRLNRDSAEDEELTEVDPESEPPESEDSTE